LKFSKQFLTVPNFILSNLIDISVYSPLNQKIYEINYTFEEDKQVH